MKTAHLARTILAAVAAFVWTAAAQTGIFTDTRDKTVYKTVKMPDGKIWMAENLNINIGTSWCYGNKDYNCNKYGRLYNWVTAKTACPFGYRLPSNEEWAKLVSAAGSETAGKKLKATSGWKGFDGTIGNGTDDFGFAAMPGGIRLITGRFDGAGANGYWFTSTKRDEPPYFYVRTMFSSTDTVEEPEGGADPEDGRYGDFREIFGASVRCVQNTNK